MLYSDALSWPNSWPEVVFQTTMLASLPIDTNTSPRTTAMPVTSAGGRNNNAELVFFFVLVLFGLFLFG